MTRRELHQRELHQRRSAHSWHASGVVVVANRLPVEHRPDGTLGRSPGGLASALSSVVDANTHWIGWAGAEAPIGSSEQVGDVRLHPVELRPREVREYYHGFANALLWPLFHNRLRQPQMTRSWWRAYQVVNERYADKVAQIAPLNGLVWVHDYHLLLTPALIRARRPDLRIGLFLHIPFPGIDLFATLPWRGDIARGMSCADLLGFQTEHDASNAAAAIEHFADDRGPSSRIPYAGDAEIGTFPISIDFQHWSELGLAASDAARRHRDEMGVEFIFTGVDRLDYTKGIVQRLRAFRELLDDGVLDPCSCAFVQVSVPSREGIADYGDERVEVERLVAETNDRHRRPDGTVPIHHITTQLDEQELAAWYRAADCLVVTSYADGMNLVAKEFVASRDDVGASVVLSEFAGAAQDMPGALIVNPYDIDAVKQALLDARRMHTAERDERMRSMRSAVCRTDVHTWAASFLRRLGRSRLRSISPAQPQPRSTTELAPTAES